MMKLLLLFFIFALLGMSQACIEGGEACTVGGDACCEPYQCFEGFLKCLK